MIERMDQERCTCGSDDCPSCFPGGSPYENDNVPTLGEAGIRLPRSRARALNLLNRIMVICLGVSERNRLGRNRYPVHRRMVIEFGARMLHIGQGTSSR